MTAWTLWGDTPTYPPGSSLLRAGLLFDSVDSPSFDTPVSQPNADWADLVTLPWHPGLSVSTDANWILTADTGTTDRDSRVARANTFGEFYSMWISWELATSSLQVSGFGFYVSGTCDLLVALAP
jgi:hypothetical protein